MSRKRGAKRKHSSDIVKISDAKKQIVEEIFKPARKHFKRRKTVILGFDDIWQSDLADLKAYSRDNRNHKFILFVIDCFSKYVWARALKSKTADEIEKNMASIFEEGRVPKNLQTDAGKEFYNSKFKKLMQKYKINHYSTYSVMKAAMAERVIRTIKTKLFKYFTLNATYNWIDVLAEIIREYNSTLHHTTGKRPVDITEDNASFIDAYRKMSKNVKATTFNANKDRRINPKFKKGDIVRISKMKCLFEKGYTPNWSTELFKITKVNKTDPTTYLIEDSNRQPIKGCFYEEELQKTNYPEIYLVEKVIRRKGNKLLVKWLGLDSKEWISTNDVT